MIRILLGAAMVASGVPTQYGLSVFIGMLLFAAGVVFQARQGMPRGSDD
jgi:hypothetical protein